MMRSRNSGGHREAGIDAHHDGSSDDTLQDAGGRSHDHHQGKSNDHQEGGSDDHLAWSAVRRPVPRISLPEDCFALWIPWESIPGSTETAQNVPVH